MNRILFPILLTFVAISFGACTSGETRKTADTAASAHPVDTWARPAVQGAMGGAYFVYKNELAVPDTIVNVYSNAARMTQIHETYLTDDGISGMREIKDIILEPGETLTLEPGGKHLMLMNLNRNLVVGDSISVTLTFKQVGEMALSIPILEGSESAGHEDTNHNGHEM